MKHPIFRVSALMVGLALILTACSSTEAEATACDAIEVKGAWFRMPPAANGALYFTATNTGDTDLALTGATSDIAETIELHEVVPNDGMMKMQALDPQRIDIPAGETVVLKQGDLHVMAMNVTAELEDGADVEFVLTTDAGCTITVVAPVTVQSADMGNGMGNMDGEGNMEGQNHGNMGNDG